MLVYSVSDPFLRLPHFFLVSYHSDNNIAVMVIVRSFVEGTVDHDSNDGGAAHNNKKVVLSKVFHEIVRKLWSGQFASININYFKNTFDLLHPQFKGHRQVRNVCNGVNTMLRKKLSFSTLAR